MPPIRRVGSNYIVHVNRLDNAIIMVCYSFKFFCFCCRCASVVEVFMCVSSKYFFLWLMLESWDIFWVTAGVRINTKPELMQCSESLSLWRCTWTKLWKTYKSSSLYMLLLTEPGFTGLPLITRCDWCCVNLGSLVCHWSRDVIGAVWTWVHWFAINHEMWLVLCEPGFTGLPLITRCDWCWLNLGSLVCHWSQDVIGAVFFMCSTPLTDWNSSFIYPLEDCWGKQICLGVCR